MCLKTPFVVSTCWDNFSPAALSTTLFILVRDVGDVDQTQSRHLKSLILRHYRFERDGLKGLLINNSERKLRVEIVTTESAVLIRELQIPIRKRTRIGIGIGTFTIFN